MTPIEKRKAELREYIEAREKATPGEWAVQQKSLSNFDHPYVFDRTYGAIFDPKASNTKLINRPNCDFICKAANESARIAEELLIALDEIEKASKRLDSIKFDLEFFVKDSIDQALNKIAGEE